MAENADQIYKTKDDIVAEQIAALLTRIPDANIGADSIFRIWIELFANTAEGLYLMHQLLHDDMFIQTANALALTRYGEMYGRPQKAGTLSTGTVRFSGSGDTYVPVGTVVSVPRPATEDSLDFVTTTDGTVPNPGIPGAPTVAVGAAGALTGTYEYGVTFLTIEGETELGVVSAPLILAAQHGSLSNIPLGGPGTTGRRIYRRLNGGNWGFLADIVDNVTTVYDDNIATGAGVPPDVSTAERVIVNAQASDVGVEYNIAVGAITDLSDAPPDLADVTNLVAFTGGSDDEDIETFRTELLKWVRAPQSGSPDDLEAWAEGVAGVESATAFTNQDLSGAAAPGTVTVRITGPGGSIPGSDVIDAVQAELDSHDLANITILVGSFDAHDVDVTVAVDRSAGYSLDDITPAVEAAIDDYLTSVPIGGTVYIAGIYHAVFQVAGVDTLTVTLPVADIVLAATEKAIPGTITVT